MIGMNDLLSTRVEEPEHIWKSESQICVHVEDDILATLEHGFPVIIWKQMAVYISIDNPLGSNLMHKMTKWLIQQFAYTGQDKPALPGIHMMKFTKKMK